MSGSEKAPLETDGLPCPFCGQQTEFKESSTGELVHVDGSELCVTPEPEHTAPSALWPPAKVRPPVSAGVPPLNGTPEDTRRALAEWRHRSAVDPEERRTPVMGVAILFAAIMLVIIGCGWIVVANWPEGQY